MNLRQLVGPLASLALVAASLVAVDASPAAAQCLSSEDVSNVRYLGRGYRRAASVDGQYPGTITLSKARTHTNSRSVSISVSKGVVDAGVGFDTSKSSTTTASYSLDTKDTKRGRGTYRVFANHVYRRYAFDITTIDAACVVRHGRGYAWRWVRYSYGWKKL